MSNLGMAHVMSLIQASCCMSILRNGNITLLNFRVKGPIVNFDLTEVLS